MDVLPELAWDAECGLIVLYREDPGQTGDTAYALVLEPQDGQGAYYAGDLPADAALWAVRAPAAERFRLLLYPAGTANPLVAEPVAAIPFDAGLRVDPQVPAGAFRHLSGWLFLPGAAGEGDQAPLLQRVAVPAGRRLQDVLAEQGWALGDRCGISITRAGGTGPEAARGPSSHPFRQMQERVEVSFTVVPDPRPLPDDAVGVDGFEHLEIPAVIVDLTPFGDLDALLSEGFCFIHGRHGSESGVECTYGTEAMLYRDPDGRHLLIWPCTDACHLDLLGVYYAGGHRLVLREDPATGIRLHGTDQADDRGLLIAQYFGDDYRFQPPQAVELLEDLGMDAADLALRLHADWLIDRDAWPDADWQGAEHAEAFTLAAFGGALNTLLRLGTEGRLDAVPADLADALQSFGRFMARPELAFALSRDSDLAVALARGAMPVESLLDPASLSPASALAAALEPEVPDLADWVEGQDPRTQFLVWRFMLAGGDASHWRELAITPELAAGQDLTRLAGQLRLALDPPHLGAYLAVLDDMGLDSGPFARSPRGLDDVRERLLALTQADNTLGKELQSINRDLGFARAGLHIHRSDALAGLGSALESALEPAWGSGGLPDLGTLRGRLLSRIGASGSDLIQLAGAVGGLRLRASVLALADVLGLALDEPAAAVHFGLDPGSDAGPEPIEPDTELWSPSPGAVGAPLESQVVAVPETQGETDADPRALALTWCTRVLRHQGLEFPPPGGVGDAHWDAAALAAFLDDLEDYWGLADRGTPGPLPQWQGARQQAARRWTGQWQSGLDALRSRLGGDSTATELDGLIRRMERARDCIIAEWIWESVQSEARGLQRERDDPRLRDLVRRVGQCAPADWAVLAAELDAIGELDRDSTQEVV